MNSYYAYLKTFISITVTVLFPTVDHLFCLEGLRMLLTVNYAKSRLDSGKGDLVTTRYLSYDNEKVTAWKRPVIMKFIDFKNAFDSVHHSGGS